MLKKILVYCLPVLSFLVLMQPFFKPGVPYGHDTINHLARFANYKLALKEGQIPPRFAPNLMNRYGYPVFNYNNPLPNILSAPLTAAGLHYETSFKLIQAVFFLAGGAGIFYWLKLLKLDSKLARNIAVGVYFLSPFAVNLIYIRGNIGEALAMNLLIFIGLLIELIKAKKFNPKNKVHFLLSALIFTCFLLSHNVMALFGTVFMVLYGVLRGLKIKDWLQILKPAVLSLGLSLWFWLPALLEKKHIVLDHVDLSKDFTLHFPTWRQLLASPLSFGFSYTADVDSMSFAVGKPLLIVGLIAVCLLIFQLITRFIQKKQAPARFSPKLHSLVFLTFWLLILQLSITQPLWEVLPLVNYIQFPWRLGMLISIFGSILTAVVYNLSAKPLKIIIIVAVILQLISTAKFQAADRVKREIIDYDAYVESTTTLNENRPKGFNYLNISDWEPTAKILEGEGEVEVDYWFGSKRQYHISLQERSVVVEPTMNFPGWETKVDGGLVKYIDNEQIQGRLAYQLPAGDYLVESRFTQNTWPRLVGNALFVVCLALLGLQVYLLKNEL